MAHKADLLELSSHSCGKGFGNGILGTGTGRRAQPRQTEDPATSRGGGPNAVGERTLKNSTLPGGLHGEPREKASQRLGLHELSLFTLELNTTFTVFIIGQFLLLKT